MLFFNLYNFKLFQFSKFQALASGAACCGHLPRAALSRSKYLDLSTMVRFEHDYTGLKVNTFTSVL